MPWNIQHEHYDKAGALGCEAISRQASLVMSYLEDVPSEVPPRTNCCVAATEDLIAHYIEAEVREALGETRGCLGWPSTNRLKKLRGYLKGLRTTLETARKKWCIEENEIEVKRMRITEEIIVKLFKSEERRKAFEARWDEVKARNKRALDEGTFEGPIVPIGMKPPEPKQHRTSRDEAIVEKSSFFFSEPPEGTSSGSNDPAVPAEVGPVEPLEAAPLAPPPPQPHEAAPPEGTSSGSNDAWVPAEVGPLEPLEAAPLAPEAALSKAEEVKQKIAEAPARLEVKAYEALEKEFVAVAQPEDLREIDRKKYEAVKATGLLVCSRCSWKSGCASCDEAKAWDFYCRSTLWHTASEALRPQTKPRGRPKKD